MQPKAAGAPKYELPKVRRKSPVTVKKQAYNPKYESFRKNMRANALYEKEREYIKTDKLIRQTLTDRSGFRVTEESFERSGSAAEGTQEFLNASGVSTNLRD